MTMPRSSSAEAPLARLLEITHHILDADDLVQGLDSIASGVRDLFGFKYVTIVAAEDVSAPMHRRVMLGWPEEVKRGRIGERIGRDEILAVLKPEFEVFESCHFIPAESEEKWALSIHSGDLPSDAPRAAPDRWHERDALILVLRDRIGGMLGYMSVDGPIDGAIPSRETLRSMQLFVNLVGLAVANARAHAAEVERRRLLEASHAQLRYEATHDGLTRLPNRQLFAEELTETLRQRDDDLERNDAVLFVDLDEFKAINDTLGHLAGDRVLLTVAERLRESVDGRDVVARLGGDEFAVLLRDRPNLTEIEKTSDGILTAVMQPIEHDGGKVFTSASIGVTVIEPRHLSISDVLREADTAMYAAKTNGRSQYAVFDEEMHSRSARRLSLVTALRTAIDERQFTIEYQPIVTLDEGKVVGLEALVRWHHPSLGRIEPGEFIPLAVDVGIVVPIGRNVLAEACKRFAGWKKMLHGEGAHLGLHINLATQEVLQPDVVSFVGRMLAQHVIEPEELTLEITESAILRSSNYADAALGGLRNLGVRLCIDDFGTGYSSLRYLQEFPIDTLKIDRSFIQGSNGDLESEPIIKLLTQLAGSYDVEVIAEGIENAGQNAALLRIGCNLGQGHHFAKPLHVEHVADELRTRGTMRRRRPKPPRAGRTRSRPPRTQR